jgi:uncharacterized protein (TIGR02453 family)
MQISSTTLAFLTELKANNERDWFNANKKRYEAAKVEFDVFVDALLAEIAQFDPSIAHFTAKDCVFRIYRDVRFSHDKSPYKTHFGAHVTSAAAKKELHTKAGYYIHLEPGGTFLAGGAYLPEGPWLKAIRSEIHYNGKLFHEILDHPDFKKYYGSIEGEKLKTTPKDYPADHPDIELLKHKSFLATHRISDAKTTDTQFLKYCADGFKALKPFDDFLNMAKD